jgi:hypothetical protein
VKITCKAHRTFECSSLNETRTEPEPLFKPHDLQISPQDINYFLIQQALKLFQSLHTAIFISSVSWSPA